MIVGILGPGGCGGTFLDWSLHYLSGATEHSVVHCDHNNRSDIIKIYQQDPITENPLTNKTAHNHKKTHPNNESLGEVISIFKSFPTDQLYTFYYVDSMGPTQTATTHNDIVNNNPDVLFINYTFTKSDIDKIFCLQVEKIPDILDRMLSTGSNLFARDNWSKREVLGLYYPECIAGQTINETITQKSNNFLIQLDELLNSGPDLIKKIFNFLNLNISKSRWNNWEAVYFKWKRKNNINFFQDLDKIIDDILHNRDVDLDQYNMTFAKEVVIANKLLYNHNLALKSNGVSRIGTTTKAWNELLEENIYHNLSNNNRNNI
jgi:hypothetical protein